MKQHLGDKSEKMREKEGEEEQEGRRCSRCGAEVPCSLWGDIHAAAHAGEDSVVELQPWRETCSGADGLAGAAAHGRSTLEQPVPVLHFTDPRRSSS